MAHRRVENQQGKETRAGRAFLPLSAEYHAISDILTTPGKRALSSISMPVAGMPWFTLT